MGGGLAGAELAAAVSEAGGLGTIGILAPNDLRDEIADARRLTAKPVAVNLLLPFARRPHFEAASEADVVVTFWGVRGEGPPSPGSTSAARSRRPAPLTTPAPTP